MDNIATFHLANAVNSPGSTWAGIGALALGVGQLVQTQGLPTGTVGWVTFGLSILGGLGGILGR